MIFFNLCHIYIYLFFASATIWSMLLMCHGSLDVHLEDVGWDGHKNKKALGNLSYPQINNPFRQKRMEYHFNTYSIVPFTICQEYAQTCRPGYPEERMTCHYVHCSCLSLLKHISFHMFGLRVQNNTNGFSAIWRNFQGGICFNYQQCWPALALRSVALHNILMLHKSPWLALTEASRWYLGGQEGHSWAFQGRNVQNVTAWFEMNFLAEGSSLSFSQGIHTIYKYFFFFLNYYYLLNLASWK